MARRGAKRHLKRITAPSSFGISHKKEFVWVMNPIPGPHKKDSSVPLGHLIRDVLSLARNRREARIILNESNVLVDGKLRKDDRFPVGLFDIISIPKTNSSFVLVYDSHGRLTPIKLEKDPSTKLCKVVGKYTAPGGKLMVCLHDGRNVPADNSVSVGDSVRINLGSPEISSVLKLSDGSKCLFIKGSNCGLVGTLKKVIPGSQTSEAKASVDVGGREVVTVLRNLVVIDSDMEGVLNV